VGGYGQRECPYPEHDGHGSRILDRVGVTRPVKYHAFGGRLAYSVAISRRRLEISRTDVVVNTFIRYTFHLIFSVEIARCVLWASTT